MMKQRFYAAKANSGAVAVTATESKLINFYADRLLGLYASADETVKAGGIKWYTEQAAELAGIVATASGITFEQAAAIIAVCSPRTRWGVQCDLTGAMVEHLLEGGAVETAPRASLYTVGIEKAQRILAGDMTALHGPKVEPFFHNICGNYSLITLDVWAIRAALGNAKMGENEVNPWTTGRRRMLLEAAYHKAAEAAGAMPAEFQAVVWITIRGAVN